MVALNQQALALKRTLAKEILLRKVSEEFMGGSPTPALAPHLRKIASLIEEELRADRVVVFVRSGKDFRAEAQAYGKNIAPLPAGAGEINVFGESSSAISSPEEKSRFKESLVWDAGAKAIMAAPCVYNGGVNAVIAVYQCRIPRKWQPSEVDLLEAMAAETAGGIEHIGALLALDAARKELEKRNSELEDALLTQRRLAALQAEFISMASHEFRTPIAIIEAAVQLVARQKNGAEEHLAKITRASGRLNQLVDSILSLSSLESGKTIFKPKQFDLAEMMKEVVDNFSGHDRAKDLRLDLDSDSLDFEGDPKMMEMTITNLVANALKYSGPSSSISVGMKKEKDGVKIKVSDDGKGIDESELPRLFEKFYRAGNSVGVPGTGIGLYLVKRFTEMHGGTVEVRSAPGRGTDFTLKLPLLSKYGEHDAKNYLH